MSLFCRLSTGKLWAENILKSGAARAPAVDPKNEPKTRLTVAIDTTSSASNTKTAWPATLPEQMAFLARRLAESALSRSQLASRI